MREIKKLLIVFLLGVSFCLMPVLGYGEVKQELYEKRGMSLLDWRLLQAAVTYMQENPTNFLRINVIYDSDGNWGKNFLPEGIIDTKGKIFVLVGDNIFRGDNIRVFCGKSGVDLLDEFKRQLEIIYPFIEYYATDMDIDIVAYFYTREKKPSLPVPLGYFYQGEYHLWEKESN